MKKKNQVPFQEGDFDNLKQHTLLFDGEVALIDSVNRMEDDAIELEWVTLIMVEAGTATGLINEKVIDLQAHDLLMCAPSYIIRDHGNKSDDFTCRCICISKQMLEKSVTYSIFNWDAMTFLAGHPVVHLTEREYSQFSLFYSLLNSMLENQHTMYYRESMQCILKSFLYNLYEVIGRYVSVEQQDHSMGNNLFKDFLNIISSCYPKSRSVAFYAGKLNVTPKYLSTVCKQHSGLTASMLINKFVMKDVSYLLSYSSKSIKEIMVELDFPSLSFFGKYVKKHFGMGPREFRATRLI